MFVCVFGFLGIFFFHVLAKGKLLGCKIGEFHPPVRKEVCLDFEGLWSKYVVMSFSDIVVVLCEEENEVSDLVVGLI